MIRRALVALLALAVLPGCTLGPDYQRPAVPVPEAWRTPIDGAGSLADLAWWELFQDETLRALVRVALAENTDLRLAVARVSEARAQLGVTRAARFPQVDASAQYQTRRASEVSTPPIPTGVDPEADLWKTTADLAFELDLWGRLRRATEAARADLLASEDARRTVLTTLLSDVAQAYFELLELDRERLIATRALDSRRESLRIVELRQREGLTSELDLRRAEGEVAAAAAVLPDLDRRIAQAENRLSTLLGRHPGPVARGRGLTEQPLPPAVPAGLPSSLLERRPDVRQAEQQLVAANARIGEAKAAFFPQVTLTGAFGVESAELADLFTGPARVWSLGPRITLPVFNAGRNRARLSAAEARHEQALIRYQGAIQQAFREVEDALVGHRKAHEVRAEQEALVSALERAVGLAELRYTNGLASYLEVLDAQRQLFAAELDLARTQRTQLVTLVQVYKALGGGWAPPGHAGADRPRQAPPR